LNANHWTERRVKRMQKKMEKMGLRQERLQLEWISAAEGLRFKEVMEKMERLRQSVTEQEVAETQRILKDRSKVFDSEVQSNSDSSPG
jgi:heterodisulfide reductase subunit A